MSIFSLPNETLLAIQGHLPPFSFFTPIGSPEEPFIQLDPSLRSLCATSKQLRNVYYHSLYETVVINLAREDLELRCALLTGSFLKDDKVLALVKYIIIRDTHRSAKFSWRNAFDRYVRVLPNSMYRLPTESYTLLNHLLHSILASTPNLTSLAIENTDISLDESLVSAINNYHPALDCVTLENFRQLNDLPTGFCATTSFGRICVQGLRLNEGQFDFSEGILNALCHRPPESSMPGPRLFALQVDYFPSSPWIALTFGSLRDLTVQNVDDAFASGCGGFFDRHPHLEAFRLGGDGLRHELALGSIPCLRELFRKAVKMGNAMERALCVASVNLSKRKHSQSHSSNNSAATVRGHGPKESTDISGDPGWILKSVSFTILQDTQRVLPFLLENLPPCEDLYIERERDEDGVADESTNVTQSVLWDSILSSAHNLSHLTSFGYSTFPLWDTAPSLPVHFGPSYDDDGEEDEEDYEDYFCSDELEDAREALWGFVEQMAKKCPRLEDVAIAGPEGYVIADYYLKFQVERTEKEGNSEGEGESEEEVVVWRDLRMYK